MSERYASIRLTDDKMPKAKASGGAEVMSYTEIIKRIGKPNWQRSKKKTLYDKKSINSHQN